MCFSKRTNEIMDTVSVWGHRFTIRPLSLPFLTPRTSTMHQITSQLWLKTHCIKQWFIFSHINSLKPVEREQFFFLASLVLGCRARWTNLPLSCTNTKRDHGSSNLDKDTLLWNCTPEMKFVIAAKPTKWLAATGRSGSIQVCPN